MIHCLLCPSIKLWLVVVPPVGLAVWCPMLNNQNPHLLLHYNQEYKLALNIAPRTHISQFPVTSSECNCFLSSLSSNS